MESLGVAVRYSCNGAKAMATRRARRVAVAIAGVITTREVMRHASLIAREFGPRLLWRCAVAIALRRRTTFLALVCAG
jgi:hypothetical protein